MIDGQSSIVKRKEIHRLFFQKTARQFVEQEVNVK
jgi:hypothetical protein